MIDLTNRVAVITGASRGIGAGLARAFLARGMKLGLCARGAPDPGALPEGAADRIVYEQLDVRDGAALQGFLARVEERFGVPDLWINNAGLLTPVAPIREAPFDEFRLAVDVNLTGVFLGSAAYLRRLHATGRQGTVVNIGSGAGSSAYAGWGAYCATKAAVHHFTRVTAVEEAPFGNRVFALCPGVVESGMQRYVRSLDAVSFPVIDTLKQMHRDGQLLDPESPAPAILRLAFGPPLEVEDPVLDVRDSPELQDLSGW